MSDIHSLLLHIEEVLDLSDDPPTTAHEIVAMVREFFEEAGDEETVQSLMESFS